MALRHALVPWLSLTGATRELVAKVLGQSVGTFCGTC